MYAICGRLLRTLNGYNYKAELKFCLSKHFSSEIATKGGSDVDWSGSKPHITKVDINLPARDRGKLAFVLYDVLSKQECKDYIAKTEQMGYEIAEVNTGDGTERLMTNIRNSERCIWDSVKESHKFFQRIKSYLPDTWGDRKLVSLNERLRVLKYNPGGYFKPHQDGSYIRLNGEKSFITLQLYLNEGFKGGSTTFRGDTKEDDVECIPKTGMALLFQHDVMHEGSKVLEGTKYCIRTDVMYTAAA